MMFQREIPGGPCMSVKRLLRAFLMAVICLALLRLKGGGTSMSYVDELG